jgi:hypothetical protein
MPSRPPFDPFFDPRETAVLLSSFVRLLSDVDRSERFSTSELSDCREDAAKILAYARSWAEHQGYPEARQMPDGIDPSLTVDEVLRLVLEAAELLRALALRHERRGLS